MQTLPNYKQVFHAAEHDSLGCSTMVKKDVSIPLPKPARTIIDLLEAQGFETWVIGGYVRDFLLGEISADLDMTSAAPWQKSALILKKAGFNIHETGTQHGTITVTTNGFTCELTTFRSDGEYKDLRHPDSVTFVDSIEQDLARRDFTINALAYHPERGILDAYGGLYDLHSRTIRAVGNPNIRFKEDPLRIMRAIRFSAQLGFSLEAQTQKEMYALKNLLRAIAAERIQVELTKMLCGKYIEQAINTYIDILGVVLPELLPMKGFDQKSKWHNLDVLAHSAKAVALTKPLPLNRWATLLHDVGKPETFYIDEFGTGHMTGHPALGARMTKTITTRLRFPSKLSADICTLVRFHESRPLATKKSVRKLYHKLDYNETLFHAMIDLMIADGKAHAAWCSKDIVTRTLAIEKLFDQMITEEACFSVKDLPIKGDDLLALGIPRGPEIGRILEEILQGVFNEEVPCERMALLEYAKRFKPNKH